MNSSRRPIVCHLVVLQRTMMEATDVIAMTGPVMRTLNVDPGGALIPVTPRNGIVDVGLSCSKLLSSSFF